MPPSQGGLPTGVMPPTQNTDPNQNPGGPNYFPMALPPSAGGFNPNNGPNNGNNNGPNNGGFNNPQNPPPPPQYPTRSEIVLFNPKTELKSVLVVKTSEGEFKITLKPDIAPINVENFVDLALGQKEFVDIRTGKKVKRPFYTGLNCHRVLKSVLIQCGCPFGNGRGGPGYTVNDERNPAMKFDRPGVVAMALARRGDPGTSFSYDANTAGSQFFISLAPLPNYSDQFTVIGQVTSGLETLRKIASTPTGPTDRPLKRVIIFSIDPDLPPVTPIAPIAPTAPNNDPMAPGAAPSMPGFPGDSIDPFAAPAPMGP